MSENQNDNSVVKTEFVKKIIESILKLEKKNNIQKKYGKSDMINKIRKIIEEDAK